MIGPAFKFRMAIDMNAWSYMVSVNNDRAHFLFKNKKNKCFTMFSLALEINVQELTRSYDTNRNPYLVTLSIF